MGEVAILVEATAEANNDATTGLGAAWAYLWGSGASIHNLWGFWGYFGAFLDPPWGPLEVILGSLKASLVPS